MQHHAKWFAGSLALGAALGIPYAVFSDLKELEKQFNALQTVLPDMHESQTAYNEVVKESFSIAQRYGEEIEGVTKSVQLWGRGYKDIQEAMKLAEVSTKLAVADNFDAETANRTIEGLISSYQQQAQAVQFAVHATDSLTNVSHNSQASAKDLSEALMRSASAANVVGIAFDELVALNATIIRSTGLTGATVGQGVKSIANSIHKEKAIEEFEKLGISVYEVGVNGEKSFKKITDLLLELSIKAPATGKNMEEAFRDIAGGKFQVGKLAALSMDMKEFIRVLNLSINSAGATDRQIEYQLDTISRKATTVKADIEELVMGVGQAGLSAYLKEWLNDVHHFITGLQQVPKEVWSVAGSFAKWATTLFLVKSALTFLTDTMITLRAAKVANVAITTAETVALTAEASAAARAAGSMTALGTATTVASGGLNLVIAGLIAGGTALALYSTYTGEAANAQELANQKAATDVEVKQQQLVQLQNQANILPTLIKAYLMLAEQLQSTNLTEAQRNELLAQQEEAEKGLVAIVGQAGLDRIRTSKSISDAITTEQKNHKEATDKMREDIKGLLQTQYDLAVATNEYAMSRITAIQNEANAFEEAADAIGEALGRISEFMYRYYSNKSKYLNNLAEGQIKDEWKLAGIVVPEGQDISQVTSQIGKEAANAQAEADKIKTEALASWASKGKTALTQYKLQTPEPMDSTGGGGTVDTGEDKGKKGTSGMRTAPDNSDELFRLQMSRESNALYNELKRSTDEYASSIDMLNLKEEILGVTTETTAQKLQLMTQHTNELLARAMQMNSLASDYETQADSIVKTNVELQGQLEQQRLSWQEMTKEEKAAFIQANKEYVQDERTLLKLLELADKLRTKASDTAKQANSTAIDTARYTVSSAERLYSAQMSALGYMQTHEIFTLGDMPTEEQKRIINLKYALDELTLAKKRLQDIKDSPHSEEDLLKQQQTVDELTQKVNNLKDSWSGIRSKLADITTSLIAEGNSWKGIWKGLWGDLAREAIQRLMQVQNVQSSLLGSIFGIFGGGGVSLSGSRPAGVLGPLGSNGGFFANNATGSIGNKEELSWIREGNKREAIIPLEDHKDRGRQLWLQSGKELGMVDNAPYVPYFKNQELATQPIVNVQVQQNDAHIAELKAANQLMMQQNQMLIQMMNNPGGNTTVVPIMTQVSARDIGEVLQKNPEILTSLLNRERSLNRWR
ncbi:phage tail tape measure protein [Sporomusa sphaeroides DSM 2875]|uniref:phage tail tape measure protein n=1 Tax=Sporomusa sphaeroides TaxID=47679 RepID=UPI0020300F42|nr:phage tail tape measure protein [Sporomusa sphaeroides]MCM0758511.1 phage tail tape measure protein [Sporomusa sphaeroides DSM 2875]